MAVEWLWWRMGEVERARDGNGDGSAPELRWLLWLRARTKEEAERGNEGARRKRMDAGELKARVCLPWPRWAERQRRAAVAASTRRAMPEAGRPPNGDSVGSVNTMAA